MMKKLLPLTVLAAGIMLSGQTLAKGLNVTAGSEITPDPATGCAALDNNVTVQLSKNVFAGYTCSVTAFRAGTCHSNGVNKTTTQTCAWASQTDNAGNTTYLPNFKDCGTTPNAAGTATPTVTASGRVGFRGQSGGGTVGAVELGSTTCDAAATISDVFMPAVQ